MVSASMPRAQICSISSTSPMKKPPLSFFPALALWLAFFFPTEQPALSEQTDSKRINGPAPVFQSAADSPLVLEVWPGTQPDEPGNIGPERERMSPSLDRKQVEVTESTRMITDVTKPTI